MRYRPLLNACPSNFLTGIPPIIIASPELCRMTTTGEEIYILSSLISVGLCIIIIVYLHRYRAHWVFYSSGIDEPGQKDESFIHAGLGFTPLFYIWLLALCLSVAERL